MNLLIVDDQKLIADNLRTVINWTEMGISRVFSAYSAREARLVMRNFEIDILITDIEMPEEDGLALFSWAKENYPDLIGIFLTSHADFKYAKTAIQLRGFDYILQPAPKEEVCRVVEKAIAHMEYTNKIHRIEKHSRRMSDQLNWVLDLMVGNILEGRVEENCEMFTHLQQYFSMDYTRCIFWPVWVQIRHFKKAGISWDGMLIRMVFCNVLDEIFSAQSVKVCVGTDRKLGYLLFVAGESGGMETFTWEEGMAAFTDFINKYMDFTVSVYPEKEPMEVYKNNRITAMRNRRGGSGAGKIGIFWEDPVQDPEQADMEERIRQAGEYIREHLNQSVTRAQMAEMLHLNEEYFSRVFKKYTGYTFKDFQTMERINQAKRLLEHSRFSISIIASKVGYDNFSYFSRTFKKMTGELPQEYRKSRTQKQRKP